MTGQELVAGIWSAQYDASLIPLIPGALASIAAGDDSVIDALASRLASSGSDQALGAFALVTCADDEAGSTSADAAVIAAPGDDGTLLLSWPWPTCPAWHVTAVPAARERAVSGTTPVLVREGGLDPVAPPAWASEITASLPHSTTVVAPAGGHGDYGGGCLLDIAADFLSDPGRAPDRSCVAALASPFG